ERSVVMRGKPFSALSSGTVTTFSTVSLDMPGASVCTSTSGGANSGKTSSGDCETSMTPSTRSTAAATTTATRNSNDSRTNERSIPPPSVTAQAQVGQSLGCLGQPPGTVIISGTKSHIANPEPLCQRLDRLTGRNELLAQKTVVAGRQNRFHKRRVIQVLGVVDLVPAGHAAGVVVGDVLLILADGGDHVAFHDLHVIDVVQQPKARRAKLLDQLHAPRRLVVHVIFVIDF